MSIAKSAQDELEKRISDVENYIANRGLGSKQLQKAKDAQRNLNLAILAGGIAAIAGAIWAINRSMD